jgi:hypothetical protein
MVKITNFEWRKRRIEQLVEVIREIHEELWHSSGGDPAEPIACGGFDGVKSAISCVEVWDRVERRFPEDGKRHACTNFDDLVTLKAACEVAGVTYIEPSMLGVCMASADPRICECGTARTLDGVRALLLNLEPPCAWCIGWLRDMYAPVAIPLEAERELLFRHYAA